MLRRDPGGPSRGHGARVQRPGLLPALLLVFCWLAALEPTRTGEQGPGCSPCPGNCTCLPAGPRGHCGVNCSNIGLNWAPAAADLPLATSVLDLSKNHISSLDPGLLEQLSDLRELYLQGNRINVFPKGGLCCGLLSILDLSNNQISSIEWRVSDGLCHLKQIDLSGNPFECDCKLYRLVSWLQEKLRVQRPDAMLCHQPAELRDQPLLNVSLLTCGVNYAGCLEDRSSGAGRTELVIFSSSSSKPGNFSRAACNSVCLAASQFYGGLGARRECLCSNNLQPNYISESQCTNACSNPAVMKECQWTLAEDVFVVNFNVSLDPLPLLSVHHSALVSLSSSVTPVTLSWDFGDQSPRVNTTETDITMATHKYGLPGRYGVSLMVLAGQKEVTLQGSLTVTLPPRLELHCPDLAVTNQRLDIRLVSWGSVGVAVDWSITKIDIQIAEAAPYCPPDGLPHGPHARCYQLVAGEEGWTDAGRHCLDRGGELAVVRDEELQRLLAKRVSQKWAWLGLSDVDRAPRGLCPGLGPDGRTTSYQCSDKQAYICQYNPQVTQDVSPVRVRVPDSGVYSLGLAVFPVHHPVLRPPSVQPTVPQPQGGSIELLLLPGLSVLQPGRLSSLEFLSVGLSSETQVLLQTFRPHCHHPGLHLLLPGCSGAVCSPVAVCVPSDPSLQPQPTPCPPLQQWCPFQGRCLELSSPCPPSSSPNASQAGPPPPGALRPRYALADEVLLTLPAGPPAHVLVREHLEDLLVFPGDVIALQHDAGPGRLLHCPASPLSPWRQPVLAVNLTEWFWARGAGAGGAGAGGAADGDPGDPGDGGDRGDRDPGDRGDRHPRVGLVLDVEALVQDGEGAWVGEVVCPVRVLYVGQAETPLQGGQLSAGLPETGLYTMQVSSAEPAYQVSASCPIRNGTLYLTPNASRLLLRVESRYPTQVLLRGRPHHSTAFGPACPDEYAVCPGGPEATGGGPEATGGGPGASGGGPGLYAVLDLGLGAGTRGPVSVELVAHNEVTEVNLTLAVWVERPLGGLLVLPHPTSRVLMNSVLSYTASVAEGSNPTFKWTVDDKPYFTYYNTVLNVIYQHTGCYKLTVRAMNHVSSVVEHFNVTVDTLRPMADLTVTGAPDVVQQGAPQTLTAAVGLDASVPATFRWSFGDGGYKEFEFKPPYPSSLFCPDSPNQVSLRNNVTYIYPQPGVYIAQVSVSNRYQNISQHITMNVYSVLNRVEMETVPPLLLAGKAATFEAHAWPSPYGIHYTWDFGDGSPARQGRERQVAHTYSQSATFRICVSVNNTISSTEACFDMQVHEEIEDLTAESNSPTELNMPTVFVAHLASGSNITWTFSFGDGETYTSAKPQASHHYARDGNYTVNVTASNAVSSGWTLLTVQVFVFQVLEVRPSECVLERHPVAFQAWVSGNAPMPLYQWSFGDGETHQGNEKVTHTYQASGSYNLSLHVSSQLNNASQALFSSRVCVQPAVANVSLTLNKTHFHAGEEIHFHARAQPEFNYSYLWDFDTGDGPLLIHGSGEVWFSYDNPGTHLVSVTVLNNISSSNTSVQLEVQRLVGQVVLQYNGTRSSNLTLKEPYLFTTSSSSTEVQYTWSFGDGTVFVGHSVVHAYNQSGVFNVTLTGNNQVSLNQTAVAVAVFAPIRGLTLNSSQVNVPLNTSVHFEAQMEEGDGVMFSWIVCDRGTSILGNHTMFYTFRSVGTFNITVIAENGLGAAQVSLLLFVQRELEGLAVVAEEETGGGGGGGGPGLEGCCFATNRVIHLQAVLKEGTNMSFTWNLIPPSSASNRTTKSVEVSLPEPGTLDVFLKAANLLGQLTANRTFQFLDPVAVLSLQISDNPIAVDAPMNLSVVASGGSDLQYRWSVDGDVMPWKDPWVVHTFTSARRRVVRVEVFNKVSSQNVSDTVSVQEVITDLSFTASNVIDVIGKNYVPTAVNVSLIGSILTGSDVTWVWLLPGGTDARRQSSVIFSEPKTTTITLNATNDLSGQAFSREFIVQEKIQGLELKVSEKTIAVGKPVEFTVSMAAGSDVSLILSISGDATVTPDLNKTYVHKFSRVDTYMVNLTAHNQVSSKRHNLQIQVMEPVQGLSILDCCDAAIPVGVKRTYVASIVKGRPVHYLWTFDLHHLRGGGHQAAHMSQEVTYTPEEAGSLTIYLSAFNTLHRLNITKQILVQNLLREVALAAFPLDTFINKTVALVASVAPRATTLQCSWDFGDGTGHLLTNSTTVGHEYGQRGQFLVTVNCSNLVSWGVAKVQVNIRVLGCEEPEVQVVQAPRLAIWVAQPTLVEASVDLKGCVRYGAQYLWQVLSTPRCEYQDPHAPPYQRTVSKHPVSVAPLPAEVDVRRLQLSIPKMVLGAGNYSLVFSLSYEGIPLRKAACLQLSVMAASLVPIIEGGTYRVWSRTQDLQLSAEQSYDPNMEPERQALLHYHWACQNTSKGAAHCSSLTFGLGPRGPVLGISGSELEAEVEYTFSLTVSKEGMEPQSSTQTVRVQSGHIPMVYLECVSCKAQSVYEVSHNSHVSLKGTCSNCQGPTRWRWTASRHGNQSLVLDSSSTTTGREGLNLVLKRGVLRHGHAYIFTLHVTDGNLDGEGAASITLWPNMPPSGGRCQLRVLGGGAGARGGAQRTPGGPGAEVWRIRTLVDQVHFNCSGYSDAGPSETPSGTPSGTPLLYSLLVTRCREEVCEDFVVYRGTSPEHAAYLPPGFAAARHRLAVSVTVEDHQGAAITALNRSMEVLLPDPPPGYSSLPHWLAELTGSRLMELLKQGDSQRVREMSLALITALNEYEHTRGRALVSLSERSYRASVRSNITRALTALDLSTVSDIQQTSATLAQCTAVSRDFVCEECQNSTLNKLESMLEILQSDTRQGTVTPTEIADNILNIMGDLIHQVSQSSQQPDPPLSSPVSSPLAPPPEGSSSEAGGASEAGGTSEAGPLGVAARAYGLSAVLLLILMHGRVLNEEPLVLRGAEIAATGKLTDPQSLLCYHDNDSPECRRFSIPRAFNSSLGRAAAGNSVMQLLFQVEPNPFPFNYVPNYTVSTEVASMEFRTQNGTQIPISGLDDSQAITVAVNNGTVGGGGGGVADGWAEPPRRAGVPTAGAANISRCDSVIVRVSTGNANRQAGVFVTLNFTARHDDREGVASEEEEEEEPFITAYLHSHPLPNEFNCTDRKRITLSQTRGPQPDHRKYTVFLSPETYDTTLDYFINVTTPCSPGGAGVLLEVGVFASLCQYFSESEKQWRTDGMVPLAATNASRAVCRTRHLTAFAAGLFVPANAISFILPERSGAPSPVALLVCVLGLLSLGVAGAVLHKLDQLDLRRAAVVPLCGRDGLFKYEVQVKTGWSRGAGTTAHVGVGLYGRESRSGHRHLDSKGSFARNALDIFHVATDTSLGSLWKIRVWHDNKGLSPAWRLQYVLVRDMQTGSSYYFLVEEWLSVDNEKTDGRVEVEVEATDEACLRRVPHLLGYELQRALCESHLWLSLWERPARSPFTRLQRATCCALLLQLCLLANALWYGTVVDQRYSPRAASGRLSLSWDALWAGLVSCAAVYPLYLLLFTVFRMSRSKCVSVEQIPDQADQQSVEIDDFLDASIGGSSFLFLNGVHDETNSEETNVDFPSPSNKSVDSWTLADQEETDDREDWPEMVSDVSVIGGAGLGAGLPRLKRGQGSRHLGVDMTFNPDDPQGQRHKHFTSSDEDLIKHILTDGQTFFPQPDESEMADLSSIFGDKTEVILLQRMSDTQQPGGFRRDPPKTAFTSNTVVTDVCRPRRLPPWCGRAALWGSWAGILLANGVTAWAGYGFSQGVAMMWLISCCCSFLCSCLLLEPLKVVCEAVYWAVCVRRLRPEAQDVLVDFPRVERVVQRVSRVRPPQGFALSQARHQARKVTMLHSMLKNFLFYMFFLLVVLLLNYSDTAKDTHSLRLRTQLERTLLTPHYHNISRREDVLRWLKASLCPRLLNSAALLADTGTVLLGTLRLRQLTDPQDGAQISSNGGSLGGGGWAVRAPDLLTPDPRSALDQQGSPGGEVSVYQLNRTLEQALATIDQLQQNQWLSHRTRALVVEFGLYNTNTDLLAAVCFLFEFPVSERAQSSLDLPVVRLWPIEELDLQLLLTVVLLGLVLYFLVRGVVGVVREGRGYLLCVWRLLGVAQLCVAMCVCALHLSRCTGARRAWGRYLRHQGDAFTDFLPLANQSRAYTNMAALLLFVLVLKASHQLRFLREWAVFGRALRRSVSELLCVSLASLLLLLAYAHTGHLLFSSGLDGYGSVGAACLSLLSAGGRGLLPWRPAETPAGPASSVWALAFAGSAAALRLLALWLAAAVLMRNYRRARAELQRPPADLQDHEMVELLLRRLKMWLGLSRAKEFRHKVRFEGVALPPSRSSSTSDCQSLCLPPLEGPESPSPDAGSEASWCPPPGPRGLTEPPGPGGSVGGAGWRERAETEASLRRLLPTLDALLQQLERVTMATEDLFHTEVRLERARRRGRDRTPAGREGEEEPGRGEKKGGKQKEKSGKKEKKEKKEKARAAKKKTPPTPSSPLRAPPTKTLLTHLLPSKVSPLSPHTPSS